ncbi:hypothetical protein LCGC14_1557110 [marine sediment metagenome]|uniref:Uncharacterized protein n=1 Tax=marine sediment metagenome TaxID=412755 RepID=A0A0F9L4W4_9ZZZZ
MKSTKKDKTYFVIFKRETGGPEIRFLGGQSVIEFAKVLGQESIAIFEGNIIKEFDSKMDLSKL